MLHISFKMEKSFIAHPWRLLCVVGLEEYSAHDWRAATSGTARSSYLAWVGPVVYIMGADILATEGARVSTTTVLTMLNQVPAC